MLPFSYRCPDCGWDIETLLSEVTSNERDAYQSAVCPNCQQLHSVNPCERRNPRRGRVGRPLVTAGCSTTCP